MTGTARAGSRLPPWRRWLRALALLAAMHGAAAAWAQPAQSAAAAASGPADAVQEGRLVINNRPIATFRATLLGRAPRERALAARTAVEAVVQRGGPGQTAVWRAQDGNTTGLQLDGIMVFYLSADDLDPGLSLAEAAEVVRGRLQIAVNESREKSDPHRIALGIAYSAAATVLGYLLLRATFSLRRRASIRVTSIIDNWDPSRRRSLFATYLHHARSATLLVVLALTWAVALLVIYLWATFVLRQFGYTRAWGERAQTPFTPPVDLTPGDEQCGWQSLLGIGHQDTDPLDLTAPPGMRIVGASSDHLVIASAHRLPLGSEVAFRPGYSALVRAMGSRYLQQMVCGGSRRATRCA